MTSTKTKSGKSSSKKKLSKKVKMDLNIPDAWINELQTLRVNDENWDCFVAMVIEQCSNVTVYTDHFNEAAINGSRLAVKTISTLVVVRTIMKNIVENKLDTPLGLLCNEIYKIVGPDFEEDIPVDLLAPLIKYIILEYKNWNKGVREGLAKMEKEFDDYHNLWQLGKTKSSSGKTGKTEGKSDKSIVSDKKQAKTKAFTNLRKRGEEWKDIQWIDDSPADGPKLYIIISSFYDANLIKELLKYEIPLKTVIKMELIKNPSYKERRVSISSELKVMFKGLADFKRRTSPFLSTRIKRRTSDANANLDITLLRFWDRLENLKYSPSSALSYKEVMFLSYIPHNNFQFKMKEFQDEIYQDFANFLYNAFETTEHHKEYLKKMRILDVTDSKVCELSQLRIYNSLLDNIPHEVITIPIILDVLLTQVCINDSEVENYTPEKSSEERSSSTDEFLVKLIDDLNVKYDLYYDPGHNISNSPSVQPEKSSKLKMILKYSDDVNLKTFQLDRDMAEFLAHKTRFILKTAWEEKLNMAFVQKQNKNNKKLYKLCNEVIKIYNETNENNLYYYVYVFMVNSILNSLLLQNWENPYENLTKYYYDYLCEDCIKEICCGISRQISFNSSTTGNTATRSLSELSLLRDMFYIEHLNSDILLQQIQSIYHDFNRMETMFCPFTDQAILIFHNLPQDLEEVWMGKLTTQVPLRDFVEYILDEENYWFRNKDKTNHDSVQHLEIESKSQFSQESRILKIPQVISMSDFNFISQRSLKYESMMKQHMQQISRKSSPKVSTSRKEKMNSSPIKHDLKKEDTAFSEEVVNEDFIFLGYDLGNPKRFQFNGCKRSMFLDSHCKVTLDSIQILYGKISHRLNVKICDHNLYYTYEPGINSVTSFHLVLSSGIVLCFGSIGSETSSSATIALPSSAQLSATKQIDDKKYSVNNNSQRSSRHGLECSSLETFHSLENFSYNVKEAKFWEIPILYNLKMSTPSGLHVELVKECDLIYVKQTQLSKYLLSADVKQEKFRCCMSDGTLLKYFVSGDVIALRANGEIYTIYASNAFSERKNGADMEQSFDLLVQKDTKPQNTDVKSDLISKLIKDKQNLNDLKSLQQINEMDTFQEKFDSQPNTTWADAYDFKFTSSNGKVIKYQNACLENQEDLFISTSIDISNNCIESERSDGVTYKHYGDGSLQVSFQDGSRLTSTPVKAEEVFCEWSPEELRRWFALSKHDNLSSHSYCTCSEYTFNGVNTKTPSDSLNDRFIEHGLSDDAMYENDLLMSNSVINQNIYNNLSHDGFVVYNISYRFEHTNYCTVYFNVKNSEIEFALPQSTRINLRNDGSYEVFVDKASLTVDNSNICFNKVDEGGEVIRRTVINSLKPSRNISEFDNIFDKKFSNQRIHSEEAEELPLGLKSLHFKDVDEDDKKHLDNSMVLFYSVDCLGNEMYIDYDLRFYKYLQTSKSNTITESDVACFVIDRNLKGIRLVNGREVQEYLEDLIKNKGLIKEDSFWNSIFTCIGIEQNESEKWSMVDPKDKVIQSNNRGNNTHQISTYGKNSWFYPFREKSDSEDRFRTPDVAIIRLLYKIPSNDAVLTHLNKAIDEFKKSGKPTHLLKANIKPSNGQLNLDEIVKNSDMLDNIYKEENLNKIREENIFRRKMKHKFVYSLVRQACIKSRNLRQKIKNNELKAALRRKTIVPYHLSCFGLVHDIINEVIGNVPICPISVPSSTTNDTINNIIDDILNFPSKENSTSKVSDMTIKEAESVGITSLVNEILQNVSVLKKDSCQDNLVSLILDKPLNSVTSDEINFLCQTFEKQRENCLILDVEEFILQDILDARHQLSHYFFNLRDMLKYYRSRQDNVDNKCS